MHVTSLAALINDIAPAGAAGWVAMSVIGLGLLLVLAAMLRADRTIANVTLALITLAAFTVALTATLRPPDPGVATASRGEAGPTAMSLPALACVDDLAGDAVLTVCERALFASADTVAAAVSYAGTMISRLAAQGSPGKDAGAELASLRRAVERDRYGLMAQVLTSRNNCSPSACAAFATLKDASRITANMERRKFDEAVTRYAALWGGDGLAASHTPAAPVAVGALPENVPTGRPSTIDFPTSDSIPPVTIMTEPAPPARPATAATKTAEPAKRPTPRPRAAAPAAQQGQAGPVQLAPVAH